MTRPRLTPTQKKILQFVADGGERGRMLVQIVASGGSWLAAPVIRRCVTRAVSRMPTLRSASPTVCASPQRAAPPSWEKRRESASPSTCSAS